MALDVAREGLRFGEMMGDVQSFQSDFDKLKCIDVL